MVVMNESNISALKCLSKASTSTTTCQWFKAGFGLIVVLLLSSCADSGTPTGAKQLDTQSQSNSCANTECTENNNQTNQVVLSDQQELSQDLRAHLIASSAGQGIDAYILPESDDFDAIPQDPSNPITAEKVALGKLLFHDHRFALNGQSGVEPDWSCSTCHQMQSGFKPGIAQGIGEGGEGIGESRRLILGFDPLADDDAPNKPDMQPIAVPSILNIAYQDVVLWNGQLGNASNGVVNAGLPNTILTPNTLPSTVNARGLSGIESQAVIGQQVHRLRFNERSPLQTDATYRALWQAAYPTSSVDIAEDVGKAIAAYERTLFANRSPFQRWLKGDETAMNESELRGAYLFFTKAGCSACHAGPALSSAPGALESELFFAVGFDDFDNNRVAIHGPIADSARLGRGGFTQNDAQNYAFKVPQLYNLADAKVFGHGASFDSIKAVVQYKNLAVAQNSDAALHLDARFTPLGLSIREVNELTTFLSTALYDPALSRYVPALHNFDSAQ